MTIEQVRGRVDDGWRERLAPLVPSGPATVDDVVCALLDGDAPVAATTAVDADVELVGGRRFWVVQVVGDAAAGAPALLAETHAALAETGPDDTGPLGLCVLVPPAQAGLRPEAEWRDPRTVFAGRLEDGTQLRLAYFDGAVVRPRTAPVFDPGHWDLTTGPAIHVFAEQDAVSAQDVADLWLREGAMPPDEAARRVAEVLLVAVEDGRVVGVTTTFLQDHPQLGMPMWFGRGFVATSERRRATAVRLGVRMREVLSERYTSGRDQRAAGMVWEVENPVLRQVFPEAVWLPTDFTFIGVNARDDDVRVHWFPGARVPW